MSKNDILTSISRGANRFGLKVKKHSPEILIVAGVVGTVTSAVMACKATLKVNDILDEHKENVEKIHEAHEHGATVVGQPYSEEDYQKDTVVNCVQTGVKLAKLYGPAIVIGAASVGCILTSHNILRKRNIALAAAYMTEHTAFKDYRNRLIDRFGKELDRELKYNIKTETVEERVVDENGNEKIVKSTIDVADTNVYSHYSIVFDDGNEGWSRDPELTKFFLIQQQNLANEMLQARGHLFLNEVYDMLGARRTKEGAQVGWVRNGDDGFVDFGIFDIHKPKARDFVNGYERVIVLDFNVDGPILDLI